MYVIRQRDVESLLIDLSNFTKYQKPTGFDQVNKKLEVLCKIIFSYCIFGSVFYNVSKILTIPSCISLRKINEVCGVAIPFWVWFDTENWLIKYPIILYTFIIIIIIDKVTLMVAVQVLEIGCNIKLRIDQLKSMLVECFDEDFQTNRKRLNKCIKYHNEIIKYFVLI